MAVYHSIQHLRSLASGESPGARAAHTRLVWVERGRFHAERGVKLSDEVIRALPRTLKEAYLEGLRSERQPLGVHKSRKPSPLRAGSAEVRAAV